jgi:hypothetical protein
MNWRLGGTLTAVLGFVLGGVAWGQTPGLQVPDLSSPVLGLLAPGSYVAQEMRKITQEIPDVRMADLTLGQYADIAARLQIAKKKDELLSDAVKSSLLLPGLAQFQDGHGWEGTGFGLVDVGILGGAGYLAYQLVPSDYKNGSRGLMLGLDLFPSLAVLAGAWLAWEGWGTFAASRAVPERRERLNGQVTIVPEMKNGEIGFSLKW